MTARKPTSMKLLEGTYRRDRANPAEPKPEVGAEPPPWLPADGPARDAWNRLAPVLTSMRVLTEADGDALAVGCVALADYLAASADPIGWRRASDAWKRYVAVLVQFGMTPSSRARVAAVPVVEHNPFDEWMAEKAARAARDASTLPAAPPASRPRSRTPA